MLELLAELLVWVHGGIWSVRERVTQCRYRQLKRYYLFLYYLYLRHYGCYIGHSTTFANMPILPHGFHGVFIAGGVKIGSDCVIFHQVTIGANAIPFSSRGGTPVIGNNCYIGAGAVIVGGIEVGDNCRIGANCTVACDIPANSVVVSQPPRIIQHSSALGNRYYKWSPKGPVYYKGGQWILETDKAIIDNIKDAL